MCQARGKCGNRYCVCFIFNIKRCLKAASCWKREAGFHKWTQRRSIEKQVLLLCWQKNTINQHFHCKVNVHLTCLICYANTVSESAQLCELCTYFTLKWKGYGQCQGTEFFQWGVLPLYIPLTKYPLKHRKAGTQILRFACCTTLLSLCIDAEGHWGNPKDFLPIK